MNILSRDSCTKTAAGFLSLLTVLYLLLVLPACGFHLRGTGDSKFPEALAQMRVTLADDRSRYAAIVEIVQETLHSTAGVTLVDGSAVAPHLILSGERIDTQVLSVNSDAKVSEYLVRYELSYQLFASDGRALTALNTFKLQRDYRFDRFNVLAKEKEEAELHDRLRRDAAHHIVLRLAKLPMNNTAETKQ